jgi:hypothetical protein
LFFRLSDPDTDELGHDAKDAGVTVPAIDGPVEAVTRCGL